MKNNKAEWARRRAMGMNKFDVANEVIGKAVMADFEERREKFVEDQAKQSRHSKNLTNQANKETVEAASEAVEATNEADSAETETVISSKRSKK
jgi:hypothetical protein